MVGKEKTPSSVDSGVFGRDEWVPSVGGIVTQIGLVRSKCDESLLDWAQVDGAVLDIDASQAVVDGIQHGVNQVVAFLGANHWLVVLVAEVNRHPEADGFDASVATESQGHLTRMWRPVLQDADNLGIGVDVGDEQGLVRGGRPHGAG